MAGPARLTRRRLIGWLGAGAALPALGACGTARAESFPLALPDAEWRRRLTRAQYHILRERGTEYPGSSALLAEHRRGVFACAADGNPVFASAAKYDSGTGWPSFRQPLPGAVGTARDWSAIIPRTEVHCAHCGGHLGHVFDDGPPPTGKRYCMNGAALLFRPV